MLAASRSSALQCFAYGKVGSWTQQVVADGPLYKEYAYEVRFDPEGCYKVRVRVEAELPLVHVAEEYDMGSATAGRDFLVLALNDGWKPDTAFFAADRLPAGNQQQVRDRRIEHDAAAWREPLDFTKSREHSKLYPTGDWGPKSIWYGLFADGGASNSPFVGILTEHTGAWRLPNQSLASFWWNPDGSVLAKLRLSIHLNGAPQNPFSTEEIDPSLPQTLGRRQYRQPRTNLGFWEPKLARNKARVAEVRKLGASGFVGGFNIDETMFSAEKRPEFSRPGATSPASRDGLLSAS